MKWLFKKVLRFISAYKYEKYKQELDNMGEIKITEKQAIKLQKRLDSFITGLKPEEVILLGTLYDRFWLELAFMEAIKYKEIKQLFERAQIEALQHYIIRGEPAEKVNGDFALIKGESDIDTLVYKFKTYCAGVRKDAIDTDVN